MEFYQQLLKAKKENKVYAVATVVQTEGNTPRKAGAKMIVFADGSIFGSVGGGVVEAKVNGKKEVVAVTIKPEAVDPDDVEMLQDLVVSAVNEALRQAGEAMDKGMEGVTGKLNLGAFGL